MNPIKYRYLILIIALLGAAFSLKQIPTLKADYSFENLFPKDNPGLAFYQSYREKFGSDEQLLMLAVKKEPSVFDSSFIQTIRALTFACRESSYVHRAQSLATLSDFRKTPFGLVNRRLLKSDQSDYQRDSLRILSDPRFKNVLISEDAKTMSVLMEIHSGLNEVQHDSLINQLDSLCHQFKVGEYYLGGDIYTEVSYIRMLEAENLKLIPLFALVVTIVLILLYRSFISISVPTISVILGLILLYGYAAWIGRSINLATLMFPTIMTVVGMSDLIHFYTRYQEELRKGVAKLTALNNSLSEVRKTLFLTSLTTIIGFLSVARSSIPHVQTFGLDGAVGVGIAFLIAITFTPVLLSFLPAKSEDASRINWDKICHVIHHFNQKHPWKIIIASLILLVLSIIGISRIDNNNFLLGAISDNARVKQDYLFFEENLAGVRAFELAIQVENEHTFKELEVLQHLESLEQYLGTFPSIGPIFSPLTFFKSVHSIEKGGSLKQYKIPTKERDLRKAEKYLRNLRAESNIEPDFKEGRLTAKMQDIGRLEVQKMNAEIGAWINQNIPDTLMTFQFTGSALLVDQNNEHLISQMFSSFLIAFGLISLIMAWLFRDWKMILFSLVPNLYPLILVGGVMGWLGVELNGSTSIIFTIAFVIAVDDTIHFLSNFKQEIGKNPSVTEALVQTFLHTGKAIMITSIILIAGYFLLFFSDFKEAWYHGVLICFTLFWALVADLFLLPVLLQKWWHPKIENAAP